MVSTTETLDKTLIDNGLLYDAVSTYFIRYSIIGYNIFIKDNDLEKKVYSFESKIPFHLLLKKSQECSKILKKNSTNFHFKEIQISTNELLNLISTNCSSIISKLSYKFKLDKKEIELLIFLTSIDLFPLGPILLDENITEAHISINNDVIIDHKLHGRMNYFSKNLSFSHIKSLKNRCELEARQLLIKSSPSIKTSLNFDNYRTRISIESPPLVPNNYDITIRRQKTDPYTIQELINSKMLSKKEAYFLFQATQNRKNISIVGEPYSGKTTLVNALLSLLPPLWKIIIIEDTDEILIPKKFKNVSKIIVPSLESNSDFTNKSKEITKLLHRSPDYVIIGEVQDKRHSNALFEGYGAGIKGIHTIHSDSIENLVRRWVFAHNVNPEYLNSLDYIVMLEKRIENNKISRIVKGFYQLEYLNNKIIIFKLNPNSLYNNLTLFNSQHMDNTPLPNINKQIHKVIEIDF